MMIEPPRDVGRTRIFEVNNRVLVTIKLLLVEQRTRTVDEAGEFKIDVASNALAIEPGEQRGRGSPVEAFVVIKDPNSQGLPQSPQEFLQLKPQAPDQAEGKS